MNDFQEQAKNWLRNVVKQDPDKIKAGVEKAGDLIDKQTGGKYADKIDSVQEKVGDYVDSQAAKEPGTPGTSETTTPEPADSTAEADGETAPADEAGETGPDDGAPDAESHVDGGVVGGDLPDVANEPSSSAGSNAEGAETGATATGGSSTDTESSEGGLPGPRP
jgi:hypothetical protein